MKQIVDVIGTLTQLGIFVFAEDGKLKTRSADGAMTPAIIQLIRDNKDDLLAYFTQLNRVEQAAQASIKARPDRQAEERLSYSQQRLWLLDQLDGGSAHYNLPGALRLSGALDVAALNKALATILERHESLRTCFRAGTDGEPRQVIQPAPAFTAPVIDLSHLASQEQQERLAALVANEAAGVFNLASDLMLRATLLKLAADEHILLLTMHHIASDGWSMGVFTNEFSALYAAFARGEANPLPPLAIQFADYARWQRDWLQGEVLEQQLGYWDEQLAGLPLVHGIPLDFPRPPQQTFDGATHTTRIDAQVAKRLNTLCQARGATLFMGLHAAFSVLLSRYSNETDIVVGSPIANREQAEIAPLIGFFVNTLVLRSDLSADPSFTALLDQSRRMLFDAYAHQQVPFEQIVERLQPQRSLSHGPLFQVMLVLQNNEEGSLSLPGLTLSAVEQGDGIAKYDLTLNVGEGPDGLELGWEYNTDLFEAGTIARMAGHFKLLLTSLLAAPDESVFKAPMLDEAEREQLLVGWNQTQADYPLEKCLHTLFEEQAARDPQAVAVVAGSERLSYGELNARANRLAHDLLGMGVQPDDRIAICAERGAGMIVAMLATLKAGAGYVPLDPAYPADRLAYMLQDSTPRAILTQGQAGAALPPSAVPQIDLDADTSGQPEHNPVVGVHARHLAYIIYTSGSTGMPKGVMIEHANAVNFVYWSRDAFDASVLDRTLFATSLNFDLHVYECFVPLSVGASVTVVANALALLNEAVDVSLINTVPSAIEALVDAGAIPSSVRAVNLAGEALKGALVERIFASSGVDTVCNLYGPSETTTYSTWVAMPRAGGFVRHIGRPVANTTVYLLDAYGQPVPTGVAGEIYIGGAGVARGYLNRPDLSAERFLPDPFTGGRMYRTGDLGRYVEGGNIEYRGRIDHQVKIRGFRIELGEIEHALVAHPQVRDAVVIAKEGAAGDTRLVAYIAGQADAETLRAHLAQTLPEYMLPSAMVVLDSLPLTPNGKLDRKALPEPDLSQAQASYVAPATDTERALCDIWQDVLGVAKIGTTDNFFQLGGHSLLATRVVARINQRFNTVLPLKALFQSPTLSALAQEVARAGAASGQPPLLPVARDQAILPSYVQQRLWVLDQIDGGSAHYNLPAALRLTGQLNLAALTQALQTILERHESLRTTFAVDASGQPFQSIQPAPAFSLPVTDLSHLMKGEQQLHVAEQVTEEAGRPFNLGQDLMLRASLLKLAGSEHILLLTMHHIASDGWSMGVFVSELSALYGAFAEGRANPLPPLTVQYADYAHWQRSWLQGDVLEQQLGYWTTQLAGLPVVHGLPLDHPRPQLQTFAGATIVSRIDAATVQAMQALCQSNGATLFMGLHAAFSVLLSRYSSEKDIVVGTPIANREQAEIAPLIGFFVNTLVLRSDLSADPSFTQLLAQGKRMLLDAYAHQQVPFEQIVERLQPERSLASSPLFQIMLALQNNAQGTLELPGLSLSPVDHEGGVAKYDLTLNVGEGPDGLELGWEYNTDLFEAETIARMAGHFELLLTSLLAAPDESVFKAPMLDEAEREQLLVGWNQTQADYPLEKCLHTLFEEQAARDPQAVAIVAGSERLSYGELNARANRLAHHLLGMGVQPDDRIAICAERGAGMIVAMLATLKAGAGYVPLDPAYPADRLAYMLQDSAPRAILTQGQAGAALPPSAVPQIDLDADTSGQPECNPVVGVHAQHLAYIIYTSGSTGMPKGVMIEHANAVNFVYWSRDAFDASVLDKTLFATSLNFDLHVYECFVPLSVGASVTVVANALALLNESVDVSLINTVPSAIEALVDASAIPSSVRAVNLAGEALKGALVERIFASSGVDTVCNLYGPSETTTYSTWVAMPRAGGFVRHIGRPVANTTVYLLDAYGQPVPTGVAGEIYIGGAGVARGYLNRPDLSAERFLPDPFTGGRMYRTGDLGRYVEGGNIEYRGRIDHQVKIRGFRIELGEIEHALVAHPQVRDAVVIAKEGATGDTRLVAYIAGQADAEILRAHLAQTLPEYMLPSAMVVLDALPLTPNGKLDRKALPEPDLSQAQASYVAPATDTERALCEIWQDVLGVAQVGATDNFFQLGGHSLLATRVVARINQHFNTVLPLKALFQAPTLSALAQEVEYTGVNAGRPALQAVPRDRSVLLSYVQQRLWVLDQIGGGSAHYNLPGALKLSGSLDVAALTRALEAIVARHESLRTTFDADASGQPFQVIHAARQFALPVIDLTPFSTSDQQRKVDELVDAEAARVFDLGRDLMLRASLLKLAGDEHILLLTMHHIASDGWSMGVFINEMSALYGAFVANEPNPLPPLALQYADYAHWQRNWLQGDVLDQQLGYWSTQLAGLPVVHGLPLDRPRPAQQTFAGATYASRIDSATGKALHALCQANGATLFMGLHAAFSVLLARHSNETDIVIGSPIANREQAEIAPLIGFFVNTLVLRSDLSANPSFAQLLAQSKRTLLDAYAHQQVPFEQIVERLQPQRSLAHSPLFQVVLSMQNNELGTLDLPGLRLSPVEQGGTVAKYELTLTVGEGSDGLELGWEYNTALFDETTIARMAGHFDLLLAELAKAPHDSVFKAAMIGHTERSQLLAACHASPASLRDDRCIHALFEEQAARHPEALAVVYEDDQLTYAELNTRANRLAHYLASERQVGPDVLVGICVERSLDMVVGILAILKAGGAYVPLDPSYPAARLSHMLEDARLETVLVHSHLRATVPLGEKQAVCLDSEEMAKLLAGQPEDNRAAASAQSLAYVIYTSGSTGLPKGVMVNHAGVVNTVLDNAAQFGVDAGSVFLQSISLNFDAAGWVIWMALGRGATLVVANEAVRAGLDVAQCLSRHRVSHLMMTPSSLAMLEPSAMPHLHTVILGGEACSSALAHKWLPYGRLFNAYGPTETSICATVAQVADANRITIGKAIANTSLYVVDAHGGLVPEGVAGELLIGGAGLARGYLNRPELTTERFIPHPFGGEGERLYRTGDLVRRLPDGELAFLGRIDDQVKIRGFRIELGEIEHALAACAHVGAAVVLAKDTPAGDRQLVAYIVGDGADVDVLRQQLGASLPAHMVPAAFVKLAALPLTPNGKLDRKALPEPDLSQAQALYAAPQSDTERILCDIWQEVLGMGQVGRTDHFFQLGGHSLLATRVVAQINQRFGVSLPLRSLFRSPVLAELAQEVLGLDRGAAGGPLLRATDGRVLLPSYAQQRLWVLDQIDGGSAHYNLPGALKLSGALDYAALNRAVTTILERHESLRTCFEAGIDGQPLQLVRPAPAFEVAVTDLSHLMTGEQQLHVAELLAGEAGRVFDLGRDLMLHASLVRLAPDEHILLVNMHHIASDGWSMGIFLNEFSTLYGAYVQDQPNPLPPLALQYADYAQWQRNWLQGDVLEQQLSYWENQLAGLPVVHGLPLDHPRPQRQGFAGANHASRIGAATLRALQALCHAQGATLFMGMHAAFSALLARYSNETDIVVGSPIANREQAEVAGLIGFFVNSLVLRSDLSSDPCFADLLAQSKRVLLDAYAHQQVPFEQIVERLQPPRSLAHSSLFQVTLVMQNNETSSLALPGLELSPVAQESVVAKYELTLNVTDAGDGLELSWCYNTELFEASTIARMAANFERLLANLVQTPQTNVFAVEMLGAAEQARVQLEWNTTQADFPSTRRIHELFEAHAAAHPDRLALTCGGTRLTFAQLNESANRLAHFLLTVRKVQSEELVGICLDRSPDMVVAILAVWKAGAAYVPLDPAYPAARLAHMIGDARPGTVLTSRTLRDRLPEAAVCVDEIDLAGQAVSNPVTAPRDAARTLAYVIYTSGSTGMPKGVMVEHRSVVNLAMNLAKLGLAGNGGQWGWLASFAFDGSVKGLTQLVMGQPLAIVPDECKRDPALLAPLLGEMAVIDCTPMMVEAWFAAGLEAQLPDLVIGGEAISQKLWEQLVAWQARHGRKAVNVYGPTECTVDTTACVVAGAVPHIGTVMSNVKAYVLNRAMAASGIGMSGELYIGGVGLARGYLNRPDLTAASFVPNPFFDPRDPSDSEKLYRSGDLVRYLADGRIEYLGRIDQQVKIRGFRIELGEIEYALAAHVQVREAVVTVRQAASGDDQLVAYAVAADATPDLAEALRQHLAQGLPEYMVPAAIVLLDALPLTPHGKVDRKALPQPDGVRQQSNFHAPATPLEAALCALWEEVLGVEGIGVTDNFFALGGHSLRAVVLVARIRQSLQVEMPLRQLFASPTVRQLAASLAGSANAFPNLVPVRAVVDGAGHPLFLVHPGEGEVGYAHTLAPWLPKELPVYGLAASGFLDGETVLRSVPAMAAAYLRAARHVQPTGALRLAGWSAGGTIALEMARQLLHAGEEVEFLALIDTTADYSALNLAAAPETGNADFDDVAAMLAHLPSNAMVEAEQALQLLRAAGDASALFAYGRSNGMFPAELDDITLRRHLAVRAAIRRAVAAYVPAPLPLPVTLFAAQQEQPAARALGWQQLFGEGLAVVPVPGTHYSVMEQPQVQALGAALTAALTTARGAHPQRT